jgi:hypothetical protein
MRQIVHPNEEGVDPLNGAPSARVCPLGDELPLGIGTHNPIQNDQGPRHPPGGKNVLYHKNKVPGLLLITTMAKEAREAREAKDTLEAQAKDGLTVAKERGVPTHLNPKFTNYPLTPLLHIPPLVYKCTSTHNAKLQTAKALTDPRKTKQHLTAFFFEKQLIALNSGTGDAHITMAEKTYKSPPFDVKRDLITLPCNNLSNHGIPTYYLPPL